MAIPKGMHVDRLDVHDLAGPLLDDYYGSPIQRQDVIAVAKEIMRRHLALLPTDTGNLKQHAKITTPRSPDHSDRRFEAVYSIGGAGADYILPLEDKHHYLDEALRGMGWNTGDYVAGPTGKVPKSESRPQAADHDRREADLNHGEDGKKAEPARTFGMTVSGKTYNEVLSRDVSGFAGENDISDPTSRRQGRGYRYSYGELSESQARGMLRRLEHGGDSAGFDDPEAIRAAQAVQRDYERLRGEFDAANPDAPYRTFMSEVQENMRKGDQ